MEVLLGLGLIAQRPVGRSTVVVGLGQPAVEADGLGEISNRFLEVAPASMHRAPGTIGLGVLGIEPNGVREVVNCLGVVALDGKHDATAAVQVGLFRLQADGFRVTGNGAIALAFLVIEAGASRGLPCRWAQADRRAEVCNRLVAVPGEARALARSL